MPRGKPKNTKKLRKDERQRKVARMYLDGKTQWGIAEQLNVTQGTISRDLKEISQRWKDEALKDISLLREAELRRLDELEAQAAEMYDRTKEAKWLDIRLKAMERRTKFIGLDAAVASKVEMDANMNHAGGIQINFKVEDCGED